MRTVLIALLLTAPGCVAALQQRPVAGHTCESSKLVIADSVIASLITTAVIYGAHRGNDDISSSIPVDGFEVAGVGLIAGGVAWASMVTGYKWNAHCRNGTVPAPTIAGR